MLDDDNQDVMFLEEILELFVRVLDAFSVELWDVSGRGWLR